MDGMNWYRMEWDERWRVRLRELSKHFWSIIACCYRTVILDLAYQGVIMVDANDRLIFQCMISAC